MQGAISIHVGHASSPAHDAFAEAVELSGEHADANGTNVGATRQAGEPQHGGNAGGASVWYAWTAPADGTLDVAVTPSGFNALLGVYRGDALDSLTSVGSGAIDVTGGTTYRIAVDGANDGQGPGEGTFALALDFTASESGDAPRAEQLTQPAGPGAGEQQDDPPVTELQQQQQEPPTEPEQQQSEPPTSEQQQEDPPVIEEQRQEDPPV